MYPRLAKNLYTSKARFVFELLQNADDNHYGRLETDDVPFVSFKLRDTRLVIECNEDGFLPSHVASICDIGKSSKSSSQAYTGERHRLQVGFYGSLEGSHSIWILGL